MITPNLIHALDEKFLIDRGLLGDVMTQPQKPDDLLPYEQDQLRRLINQVNASPERIKTAFFAEMKRQNLA